MAPQDNVANSQARLQQQYLNYLRTGELARQPLGKATHAADIAAIDRALATRFSELKHAFTSNITANETEPNPQSHLGFNSANSANIGLNSVYFEPKLMPQTCASGPEDGGVDMVSDVLGEAAMNMIDQELQTHESFLNVLVLPDSDCLIIENCCQPEGTPFDLRRHEPSRNLLPESPTDESILQHHNALFEEINHNADFEDINHNVIFEEINHNADFEDISHNVLFEDINHNTVFEDINHNALFEDINYNTPLEDINHSALFEDINHIDVNKDSESSMSEAEFNQLFELAEPLPDLWITDSCKSSCKRSRTESYQPQMPEERPKTKRRRTKAHKVPRTSAVSGTRKQKSLQDITNHC